MLSQSLPALKRRCAFIYEESRREKERKNTTKRKREREREREREKRKDVGN